MPNLTKNSRAIIAFVDGRGKAGGNAVDISIATGITLDVVLISLDELGKHQWVMPTGSDRVAPKYRTWIAPKHRKAINPNNPMDWWLYVRPAFQTVRPVR